MSLSEYFYQFPIGTCHQERMSPALRVDPGVTHTCKHLHVQMHVCVCVRAKTGVLVALD